LLEESLAIYRELGDKVGMGFYCWVSGWAAFKQGDTKRAHGLIEQGLALFREIESRWHICGACAFLGRIKAYQGDFARAHSLLGESLAEAHTLDDYSRAFSLENLAVVVAAQGEHAWAARLLSVAASLRENCGNPVTPVERTDYEPAMTAACTSLGEQAFAIAWAEGRRLTFEQVLTARGPVMIPDSVSTTQFPSSPPEKSLPAYPVGLTAREVEVLRLLAQGLTDAQIAERLIISPRTVNTHLTSIYAIEHHLLSLH
jgi:ATP/maltotriose-dependent transcriptional regulator MalT